MAHQSNNPYASAGTATTEPPPPYVPRPTAPAAPAHAGHVHHASLEVPHPDSDDESDVSSDEGNHQARRSMEDEARTLPEGWVRQIDPK